MSEVPAPQLLRQSHSRMPAENGGGPPAVPARGVPEHYQAGEERWSVRRHHQGIVDPKFKFHPFAHQPNVDDIFSTT